MDANSSLATKTPGPPDNPFNRLDARTGMALAYWAYPHRDIKSAEKVIAYPDPWRHAQPGIQLPANWPTANLDANGRRLNRTLGVSSLGGATLDNEENYLIKKLFTGLGIVQIENQARI